MKSKKSDPTPPIVVDTREQAPWTFDDERVRLLFGGGTVVTRGTLHTGDYSIVGLEHSVGIERKSLQDFVGSVIQQRDRFFAEMARLSAFGTRAVIVEGSVADVEAHRYRSHASPASIMASADAIFVDHGVPVLFMGSRAAAEYRAAWILRRVWQRHLRSVEAALEFA